MGNSLGRIFAILVPTLRVGTHSIRRSASARPTGGDAERREQRVPTQSVGTTLRLFLLVVTIFAATTARADPFSTPAPSSSRPHPAVVRVAVPERDGASYGSGSLVAVNESSGLVLTNWHVVRDVAGPIVVYFPDGFHSVAYLLRTDRDWDLAALAIRRPNVQPIALATAPPRPGDPLTIAGYGSGPYRAVTGECTQYLSPGDNQPFEMIELSAPARNGDSGGPILNSRGELAGVLFGSAFGRTSGSYCGRLRWFLALSDGDFRRISAQALLAQQSRRQQSPPPAAAIPAGPAAATNSPRPLAGEGPGVRAGGTVTDSPRPLAGEGPGVRAVRDPLPPSPCSAPLVPVASLVCQPSATPAASLPSPLARPLPTADQIKTILAAVGVLAVLYHALRLLGRAVG